MQIRIRSVHEPFRSRHVAAKASNALRLAAAMGFIPRDEVIVSLDASTFRRIVHAIAAAGLGGNALVELESSEPPNPERLLEVLAELEEAMQESPVPEHEWAAMEALFGLPLLARLLGISPASVRRYHTRARATPDDVAARLHFLAKVVADLSGAYNDVGVRRWFDRPRTALDGRSPSGLLGSRWTPEGPGATRVRDLARALTGSPAT